MIWTRETWEDGTAVCEDYSVTYWRKKEIGMYEVRHRLNRSTLFAKVNHSWLPLPGNWEVS